MFVIYSFVPSNSEKNESFSLCIATEKKRNMSPEMLTKSLECLEL